LGQHNGLPVTIIVTTTLAELEAASGVAVTGGGTLLPMSTVIRMASHAHHYLAVFNRHTEVPLYLGRTRRCASPGQRIVLYAKDRGCTRPGCTVPAYWTHVHHASADWDEGGHTNITDLTLACRPDNLLVENSGWTTRKLQDAAALRGITAGSGGLGVPVGRFAPALPRRPRGGWGPTRQHCRRDTPGLVGAAP
jgi:hypothetical protein